MATEGDTHVRPDASAGRQIRRRPSRHTITTTRVVNCETLLRLKTDRNHYHATSSMPAAASPQHIRRRPWTAAASAATETAGRRAAFRDNAIHGDHAPDTEMPAPGAPPPATA
jgi:hypothetical protein